MEVKRRVDQLAGAERDLGGAGSRALEQPVGSPSPPLTEGEVAIEPPVKLVDAPVASKRLTIVVAPSGIRATRTT